MSWLWPKAVVRNVSLGTRHAQKNPRASMTQLEHYKESVMKALTSCMILVLAWASPARAENWPAWRGPRGDGTSTEKEVPTSWSPSENVRWKVKLPGPGNSTPIVWGNRIFLTQALDRKGTERAVLCFDRAGGKLLWQKSVSFKGEEPTHDTNLTAQPPR